LARVATPVFLGFVVAIVLGILLIFVPRMVLTSILGFVVVAFVLIIALLIIALPGLGAWAPSP
jgi:hypothetical protein